MNIVLFDEKPLNGKISINDYRAQHILNILHLKEGEEFKMGLINKSQGCAKIVSIDDDNLYIDYKEIEKPFSFPITLLVSQVRPICMKRILREATCLGVKRIIITGADTTEKSYAKAKIWKEEEYKKFLLSGAMQSGQATIPDICLTSKVKEAIIMDNSKTKIILDNKGNNGKTFSDFDFSKVESQPISLAIGPERGWSDRERSIFKENNYTFIKMGKRILRTETAVPSSLSLLLSNMGLI